MATAGAGENIHNVIATAPGPLPANVMAHISTFVPNWRKMPIFAAFKDKIFHQTPFEIVEKIKAGDKTLLMAYIDYLNSHEFAAVRSRWGPDRERLLNDLLCDVLIHAPFASFKIVVDSGVDINVPLACPCYGYPLMLLLRARNLPKFAYLILRGANTDISDTYGSLINQALQMNHFEELALIVGTGQNITALPKPMTAACAAGVLAALLMRNDVIDDAIIDVPAPMMHDAMDILSSAAGTDHLPTIVIANISNRKFQHFRRLIMSVLGKEAAIAAVADIIRAYRRSHIVSGALEGGRRRRV